MLQGDGLTAGIAAAATVAGHCWWVAVQQLQVMRLQQGAVLQLQGCGPVAGAALHVQNR